MLDKLNWFEVYEELYELADPCGLSQYDITLVCYEKPEDFCHRHLIANWFNKNLILDKKIRIFNLSYNEDYAIEASKNLLDRIKAVKEDENRFIANDFASIKSELEKKTKIPVISLREVVENS